MRFRQAAGSLLVLALSSPCYGRTLRSESSPAEGIGTPTLNRGLADVFGSFEPLTCNDSGFSACIPWEFGISSDTEVIIPCGTCVTMDAFVNNEIITLKGGLNVMGKLNFPDGTKVEVQTPYVFVQGELAMRSTSVIDGTEDIKLTLSESSEDVIFTPDAPNTSLCPVGGCNVGSRPIIVAGGSLNIQGLPEVCPTWTTPQKTPQELPDVDPTADLTGKYVEPVPINEDFSAGKGGWNGNLGATTEITDADHDSNYLKISNREMDWQGPMYSLPLDTRSTISLNEMYFWSASIKISNNQLTGEPSLCVSSSTNCPIFKLNRLDQDDKIAWFEIERLTRITEDNKWFTVGGTFTLNEIQLAASHVFSVFTFNGPEAGIDISIDNFLVEHAASKKAPGGAHPCKELVLNGDASADSFSTFPLESWMKKEPLAIKTEDGNNYFFLEGRTVPYSSLTFRVNPGCAQPGTSYQFSMKIKIDSSAAVGARVLLKATHAPGSSTPHSFAMISVCPDSAAEWVTCENSDFEFTTVHHTAEKLEVLIITPDDTSDVSYDDVSFSTLAGFQVGGDVGACWGTGASVLLTSQSTEYNASQVSTLSVSNGELNFGDDITPPVSAGEGSSFATEIALLSRKIVFQSSNPSQGGHLSIYKTSTKQLLDGVAFKGFGQAGVKDSFPINFRLAGDMSGSTVSRNTILDSHQRCIVLSGTSGLTVSDNVAYNNKGHCYVLHDGSEMNNVFTRNLGAGSLAAESVIEGETDEDPATFMIRNPDNTFVDNVAAGSMQKGFWFYIADAVTGDSLTSGDFTGLNPAQLLLKEFSGNVAHSNTVGVTTFPGDYYPPKPVTFAQSTIYKNKERGIFFHHGKNFVVEGGVVADNLVGIDVAQASNVVIKDVIIDGNSGTPTHCNSGEDPLVGIVLAHDADSTLPGTTLENIIFKNINDVAGCSEAIAMKLDDVFGTDAGHFGGNHTFTNLEYENVDTEISVCDAVKKGLRSVEIKDDGGLNPVGHGSGFLVNDDPEMVGKFGACAPVEGTCTQYCGNSMEELSKVDPDAASMKSCISNGAFEEGTKDWSFIGPNTGIKLVDGVTGHGLSTIKRESWYHGMHQVVDRDCFKSGSLYEVSMDVKIVDYAGNPVDCDPFNYFFTEKSCPTLALRLTHRETRDIATPVGPWNPTGWNKVYGVFLATDDIFVEPLTEFYVTKAWEGYNEVIDNVVVKPVSASTYGVRTCDQLIVNGDAEIGDARSWFIRGDGNFGELEMVSPGATGNFAFHHVGARTHKFNGMFQYVDQDCMASGSQWKISFTIKIDGDYSCEPKAKNGDDVCPMAFIQSHTLYGGTTYTKFMPNELGSGWISDEWNKYEATFEMTPKHKAKDQTAFYVNNILPGYEYYIDDLSIVKA